MSSSHIQIPHHAIRVFDERDEFEHIIHTGLLQDNEDDDESDTKSNRNEELNDVGSEDYAEEGNCEEELPKNLSAVCRLTVGRQSTDSRPTVYRQVKKKEKLC